MLGPTVIPGFFLGCPGSCGPWWWNTWTYTATLWEGTFFSTLSPGFVIQRPPKDGHGDRAEEDPRPRWDVEFSRNEGWCSLCRCWMPSGSLDSGNVDSGSLSHVSPGLLVLGPHCWFLYLSHSVGKPSGTWVWGCAEGACEGCTGGAKTEL